MCIYIYTHTFPLNVLPFWEVSHFKTKPFYALKFSTGDGPQAARNVKPMDRLVSLGRKSFGVPVGLMFPSGKHTKSDGK